MPKRGVNCYRPKDLRYGLTFVICYEIALEIEIAGTNVFFTAFLNLREVNRLANSLLLADVFRARHAIFPPHERKYGVTSLKVLL